MSVYDRWHHSHPPEGLEPCKCGRGRNKLYPTKVHGQGKRWQVRWEAIGDDGKRCQPRRNFEFKGGGKDETDPEIFAEACDAKVTSEINTDTYIDPAAGKTPLEKFAKEWRAGLVADLGSLEAIDKRLAHIYDVPAGPKSRRAEGTSLIGPMPMAKLAKNPHAIQQWIKALQDKGLSPGYIGDIVGTLSSVFIAAIDNGMIARNPTRAKSVTLPKPDEKIITPWTPAMVEAARADMEQRNGTGIVADLGAGAGMREGEVFGLAETDIQFLGKDRRIQIRRQVKVLKDTDGEYCLVFAPPKGAKQRDVQLSDALARRLAAHIQAHPPQEVTLPWRTPDAKKKVAARLILLRVDGRAWDGRSFTHTWHRARLAAGAEPTRENGFHITRHTYASVQLAAGVDIIKLAAALGHKDPSFTWKTYLHFIPDTSDAGRAAVDQFLEPPEEGSGSGQSALDVPQEGDQ